MGFIDKEKSIKISKDFHVLVGEFAMKKELSTIETLMCLRTDVDYIIANMSAKLKND